MTVFFILIGVVMALFLAILVNDIVYSVRTGERLFSLSDALVNIYCAILERSFDLFYGVLFLIASQYLYENVAPFQLELNGFTWIIGIIIFDFIAYWFHRLSHEINVLWAAHIVHHQSEELNFTTVFRVSFFAVIFRSLFFIWMPLMGYDALAILSFSAFLAAYQLVTHSRSIGRLGFLEEIFTTPSHHRVHHGRNVKYMDHNYGHILIIWDKMFGTFVREDEEPQYGITSGFESNSAWRAQFAYWRDLFKRASLTKSFPNKVKLFLKGPAWTPEDVDFLPYEYKTDAQGNRIKREVKLSFEYGAYVFVGTLVTLALFADLILTGKLMNASNLGMLLGNKEIVVLTFLMFISVFAHGQMLERTKLAFPLELIRLVAMPLLGMLFLTESANAIWMIPLMLGYAIVSIVWLVRLTFFVKGQSDAPLSAAA